MTTKKRVSDEDILKSYYTTHNVWKTAKDVGICGQSVWERLKRLNIKECTNNALSEEDKNKIKEFYMIGFTTGDGKLEDFCKSIGRTKQFVCRYAKSVGLTSHKRTCCEKLKKRMSIISKEKIKKYGHPKGMLGKHHSNKTKEKLSKKHIDF